MNDIVLIVPVVLLNVSLRENRLFAYAKLKTQISCAVIAQLISAFVFAIRIVQSLFFLNPKFQASSHLLWLCSPDCVGPGRKPRRPVFSQRGSNNYMESPGSATIEGNQSRTNGPKSAHLTIAQVKQQQ